MPVYYREPFLNLLTNQTEVLHTQEALTEYLRSLPESVRNRVNVIYGHHVYYGIHEYFGKKPRYFTFLRNPIFQTLSHYTHLSRGAEKELSEFKVVVRPLFKMLISEQGNVMTLEEALRKVPFFDNGMTRMIARWFLARKGQTAELNRADFEAAKNILEQLYFVGVAEEYDVTALYLYYKLGIRKFFGRQNITANHYLLKEKERLGELIQAQCRWDVELYDFARKLSEEFKRKTKDYAWIVNYMKVKRWLSRVSTLTGE